MIYQHSKQTALHFLSFDRSTPIVVDCETSNGGAVPTAGGLALPSGGCLGPWITCRSLGHNNAFTPRASRMRSGPSFSRDTSDIP
jgi:hypothetical protein